MPRRSVSHSHISGGLAPPRDNMVRSPSNDNFRGRSRGGNSYETEETEAVRRSYGKGTSSKRRSLRHQIHDIAEEEDSDEVATGRRTEGLDDDDSFNSNRRNNSNTEPGFSIRVNGQVPSSSRNAPRIPKSTSTLFGDSHHNNNNLNHNNDHDRYYNRNRNRNDTSSIPKSRSMIDISHTKPHRQFDSDSDDSMNHDINGNPREGGRSAAGAAGGGGVFDPARVKREKELIKAVRAGKLKRVGDMLAADWAREASAGKGSSSVGEIISRSGARQALANARDVRTGDSALHIACDGRHYEIVTRLVGHGAKVNVKGANGATPLHRASKERKNADVVRALFQQGAEADIPNASGDTALHIAAEKGNLEIIEVLISHGANVNAKNSSGDTPLHVASNGQKSKATALLLGQGADTSICNRAGLTAFQLCRKGKVKIAFSAFGIE